jgi:hypothetical protein
VERRCCGADKHVMVDASIEAAGQALAAAVGGCSDNEVVRYHDGGLYGGFDRVMRRLRNAGDNPAPC